jgi:HMG (high mobility group) box
MSRHTDSGHRVSLSTANSVTTANEAANLQHLHEERRMDQSKEGLDTSNTNIALLLNLESMRNSRHIPQPNFNIDYRGHGDIMNNYGTSLVQQYLQRQQHQHIMEQSLRAQAFEQLQQLYPPLSFEIPGLNRQFATNPYSFVPSLHSNAYSPNLLPFQLPHYPNQQDNLLDIFLANNIDRSFLRQSNRFGSSSLAIMNSLDGPNILCDPSLQNIRQLQQSPTIIANSSKITAEHATALPISGNDSTCKEGSDSIGRDRKEQPPIRALSAYNFFFRYERERILNSTEDGNDYDLDVSKKHQEAMLKSHWNRDRTVKRRHRKSHGKISFAELSRKISQRWNDLPEHQKKFFNEVAARDWERYHHEIEQQKQKKSDP